MVSDDNLRVDLQAPDIADWRHGNTGVEYAHCLDSGRSGPDALINALMHGNELCGAIAVDRLLRSGFRPTRGRLTLCFANTEAYRRFDPSAPARSRFVDEDMNRLWSADRLDAPPVTAEARRARALRPLFDRADRLLDIHSMGTRSAPVLLIHGLAKERRFARAMRVPATVACGGGHVQGRRLIEYAPFNDPDSDKVALLVECGHHWSPESAVVAMDAALYFLRALDMVDPGYFREHVGDPAPPPQIVLDVTHGYTIRTDDFYFTAQFAGLERFPRAGEVFAVDGGEENRTPYDDCVLVMPNHRAVKGQRAFRLARAAAD
ncbi:succinylglutamate desuccinylase/aspartoacylase family protein [Thalassobaculum sp.]|uniref:succinylglutamate desuccinylase/aspartoacylase domain-containing protein n=1 Tax=Thalassobaculum sp. TaxID=2022740 RepID=UPI0032F0598C